MEQRGLASMLFRFFDKKSKSSGLDYMLNQQFENELHKPIIRIFEKERFIFYLKTMFGSWFSWYAVNK